MHTVQDFAQLGFTLTTEDARRALRLGTQGEVHELVRTRVLAALYCADPETGRELLLFHPDNVRYCAGVLTDRAEDFAVRQVRHAVEVLREYLAAVPAVDDADDAVRTSAPLRCAVRGRATAACVHPKTVRTWHNARDVVTLNEAAPVTTAAVTAALQRVGAVRTRGVIAVADSGSGRQRWSTWWRVPADVFSGGVPDPAPVEVLPGDRLAVVGGEVVVRGKQGVD